MFSKPQKTMTMLTLAAFLATSITPAMAAGFDGMPDMRYNPYGAQAQTRGATAGVYLRLPFKGGLKRPREEARVGFALSTRLSGQYHDPGRFAAVGTPRLIDLSLGLSGRQPLADSLQFNGISLNRINTLYADEDSEGEKKKGSGLLTIGILVAAGAVGLGIAIASSDCGFAGKDGKGGCNSLLGGFGD